MKKLTALALILLLLLSLTACAAEPQQAVGLSLEEAGLTAEFPFTPIVPDYRGDKPLDYEIITDINFQIGREVSKLNVILGNIGNLTASGKANALYFTWQENHGEEAVHLGATIGYYQAYRKSDLDAGQIIKASFALKQGLRYATEEPDLTYTVVLNKDTVKSSYHCVAETEEFYILDWFSLIVGDPINDYKDILFKYHFRITPHDLDEYAIFESTLQSVTNLKGNIKFVSK